MLEGLHPVEAGQGDLFASLDPRSPPLLAAIDGLNVRYGRSTVRLASEGQGARSYDTKRARKSPAWTTQLADIPVAH